jgi:hypothetical protein
LRGNRQDFVHGIALTLSLTGAIFRDQKSFFPLSRSGGACALTKSAFDSENGLADRKRPEEKEAVKRLTTKKCGSPLRGTYHRRYQAPSSGLPPFLFPVFENII